MKKFLFISVLIFVAGFGLAQAEDKKPAQTKNTGESTTLVPDENHSARTMKIQSDDKANDLRHKALVEELRKLYKANFL